MYMYVCMYMSCIVGGVVRSTHNYKYSFTFTCHVYKNSFSRYNFEGTYVLHEQIRCT